VAVIGDCIAHTNCIPPFTVCMKYEVHMPRDASFQRSPQSRSVAISRARCLAERLQTLHKNYALRNRKHVQRAWASGAGGMTKIEPVVRWTVLYVCLSRIEDIVKHDRRPGSFAMFPFAAGTRGRMRH
jgi:hypothetical protein